MDQSSLGKPRSLDSEVVIDVEEETVTDIDVAIEPDLEDPEDEAQAAQDEQDEYDANVEAIIDADTPEDTEEAVDGYGEKEDFAEEYLTISNDVAKEPAAICINTEEIGKTFDEMLGYIMFQRRDLLDDYLSLSFTEMREKVENYFTPFAKRQFFCPAKLDPDTKLPRPPTKEEYIAWPGHAMVGEPNTRTLGMWRWLRRSSHLQTHRCFHVRTWIFAMKSSRSMK